MITTLGALALVWVLFTGQLIGYNNKVEMSQNLEHLAAHEIAHRYTTGSGQSISKAHRYTTGSGQSISKEECFNVTVVDVTPIISSHGMGSEGRRAGGCLTKGNQVMWNEVWWNSGSCGYDGYQCVKRATENVGVKKRATENVSVFAYRAFGLGSSEKCKECEKCNVIQEDIVWREDTAIATNVTLDRWDQTKLDRQKQDKKYKERWSFEYPATIKELSTKGKIEWTTMPDIPVTGRQDMGACVLYDKTVIIGGYSGGFCGGRDGMTKYNGTLWHDQTSARLSHWLDEWARKHGKKSGQTPFQPRGFRRDTWILNRTWKRLPDFPGQPRQLSASTSLDNICYLYGGYSYTPIKLGDLTAAGKPKKNHAALRDGYALRRDYQGIWKWSRLPDLPGPVAGGGLVGVKRKLYFIGGGDYDARPDSKYPQSFYYWTDRNKENMLTYNVLRSLDLDRLDLGWVDINRCPGTPRMVINNLVYSPLYHSLFVMGGMSSIPLHLIDSSSIDPKLYLGISAVVDNWSFNLKTQEWKRLRDLPVGSNSYFRMQMLSDGRHAVLAGGAHKYGYVVGRDMSLQKIYKGRVTGTNFVTGGTWKNSLSQTSNRTANAIYNTVKTAGGTLTMSKGDDGGDWCETISGMNQCDCAENCPKEMRCAGLLIYDLEKDKYYRTNPLPVNINQPAAKQIQLF
eukprot:Stramenopile-MAST_4_protein_4776